MQPARALVFDFNGTLSHDEPVLFAIYSELFAEHGRPMTEDDYFGTLAGNTEEAIIGGGRRGGARAAGAAGAATSPPPSSRIASTGTFAALTARPSRTSSARR